MFIFTALVAQSLLSKCAAQQYKAQAWQSVGLKYTFPENSFSEITAKPSVGISFSGGGDRSYTASIGYLAAFHELGFIDRVRYLFGSSGGSWATVVYTYYQKDNVTDDVMLGPIVFPADIALRDLQEMDEFCVRGYTNNSGLLTGPTFSDWLDSVQVKLLSIMQLFT